MKRIRFWLDGCDISFIASAPENITLKQCDRIKPDWCACGIKNVIFYLKKLYKIMYSFYFFWK